MRKDKPNENDPARVIDQWLERDLSRAAAERRLFRAYEADESVATLGGLLAGGCRPFIVGDSGVGKTAVVWELVRRAAVAADSHVLKGKRVLQLSVAKRAAGLKIPGEEMRPEMDKLVQALVQIGPGVVPFFRDAHLFESLDLEPLLEALALRFEGLVICEGPRRPVDTMFECRPSLGQHFALVQVLEPGIERSRRILQGWSAEARHRDVRFESAALDLALQVSHRFQLRDRMPRKALDLLAQAASSAGPGGVVRGPDIIERFCLNSSIPRVLVDPDLPLDLRELQTSLEQRVVGQDEAVRAVVRTVGVVKAGLVDPHRPFATLMFVGPTGVGKTLVAQLLAEYLFGNRDCVIRLNMADHQDERSARALFGDPDEYGPRARGVLSRRVAGRSFSILLLDELEKAHPCVHDRLLQLMDEGSFINGAGEQVCCRSSIIIATSNAGAEVYRGSVLGFSRGGERGREQEVELRLRHHFRVELLNRFDQVIQFRPLGTDQLRRVAATELQSLAARAGLSARGMELAAGEEVLDWLVARGCETDQGARALCHAVHRLVSGTLADTLLRHRLPDGSCIRLHLQDDELHMRVVLPAGRAVAGSSGEGGAGPTVRR